MNSPEINRRLLEFGAAVRTFFDLFRLFVKGIWR